MKKHKFNIFPSAKAEDFARLRDDIRDNGYDQNQPVIVYQGSVLDGWNRWTACQELKVTPSTRQFEGSDAEAIDFVMRTNKRRNLNSGQWATIAVEAEDLIAAIREEVEKARREKIGISRSWASQQQIYDENGQLVFRPSKEQMDAARKTQADRWSETGQKIAPSATGKIEDKTAHKTAELFNTNRTYVNQAAKIKQAAPEVFEKVKAGKMTMQDAARAVRAIPTEPWLDDEKERKAQVEKGHGVVANTSRDKNLIQWAEKQGLMVRIDRSSEYGNPFILGDDGTRDDVCDAYENYYLPHKPSIKAKLAGLRGKVLVCHCYPERCHGEALLKEGK